MRTKKPKTMNDEKLNEVIQRLEKLEKHFIEDARCAKYYGSGASIVAKNENKAAGIRMAINVLKEVGKCK